MIVKSVFPEKLFVFIEAGRRIGHRRLLREISNYSRLWSARRHELIHAWLCKAFHGERAISCVSSAFGFFKDGKNAYLGGRCDYIAPYFIWKNILYKFVNYAYEIASLVRSGARSVAKLARSYTSDFLKTLARPETRTTYECSGDDGATVLEEFFHEQLGLYRVRFLSKCVTPAGKVGTFTRIYRVSNG